MLTLRWYQRAAVDAVWDHLRTKADNPCVEIPTGGGKSAVIATIASEAVKQWQGRVIVLAHVKELLEQNAAALLRVCPELDIGIYSAGLGMRNTSNAVIVAGIQSVFDKPEAFGRRDLIICDEVHLVQPNGEGRYSKFIEAFSDARTIGLTATPYRLGTGEICGPDHILNSLCYRVGVRALIAQGFLSKLISKRGLNIDFSGLHVERGEFVAKEADALMCGVVPAAVGEILKHTKDRKSVLIFCQSRDHAKQVQGKLIQQGADCGYVDGDSLDRAQTLQDFKAGQLKYLANINVLTTGFDAPGTDCIVLLRPTVSPGLYYQMVGRGFRIADGKSECLVLDFGGNVARHGPIDAIQIRPKIGGRMESTPLVKTCPNCQSMIAPSYGTCPDCLYVFPVQEKTTHEAKAGEEAILSTPEEYDVKDVSYERHLKRDASEGDPATFHVRYRIGVNQFISEYVCFEHSHTFLKRKSEKWWKARSAEPVPETASEAMVHARNGSLAKTLKITAVQKGRFHEVLSAVIGDKPEAVEDLLEVDLDEVPF